MKLSMNHFSFTIQGQYQQSRAGVIQTVHGPALTPMFMAVGTRATVKALRSEDIKEINPQVLLANTYHLFLRPGHQRIAALGGLHQFMNYDRPMLTDSGGFQVFSLGAQLKQTAKCNSNQPQLKPAKISDEGVKFYSHLDGEEIFLSPAKSIEIQQYLGADIIMSFDECLPDSSNEQDIEVSLLRTYNWAKKGIEQWESRRRLSEQGHYQALFGIIQGGKYRKWRQIAAKQMSSLPFDGLAFGGETVGYNMEDSKQVLSWTQSLIPPHLPRYAMGLGRDPQNIIDAVWAGFDMFDCVAPTRLARNGTLYSGNLDTSVEPWIWQSDYQKGRLQIGNAQFANDTRPIQVDCDCFTCRQGYTRAYLHYLYKAKELTYYLLASIHNVRTFVRLTEQLRSAILERNRKTT